ECEAVIESGDGRPVYVSIFTAPLARSGDVEAAVAVIRDMTHLHQLESVLRRGETLASAGQIAMGLAHEIRNPLGAIRGAVQLMRRELGDDRASPSTPTCCSRRSTGSTASSRCCSTSAAR